MSVTATMVKELRDKSIICIPFLAPQIYGSINGFLLFVPKKDILPLDMSVEEAAKLVISAGLVVPEDLEAEAIDPSGESKNQRADLK